MVIDEQSERETKGKPFLSQQKQQCGYVGYVVL